MTIEKTILTNILIMVNEMKSCLFGLLRLLLNAKNNRKLNIKNNPTLIILRSIVSD